MSVQVPIASQLRNSSIASPLHCSRAGYRAPTRMQIVTMLKADSVPSYGGPYPWYAPDQAFSARSPSGVVAAALADDWTGITYNKWDLGTAVQTPATFSSPYNGVCGSVCVDDGTGGGILGQGILNDMTSAYTDSGALIVTALGGSPTALRPGCGYGGGQFQGFNAAKCAFWFSVPMVLYGDGYVYQNPVIAQRCKYRTDGAIVGWEASAELWIQTQDGTGAWNWGWDIPAGSSSHYLEPARPWPKNWVYRKPIVTIPHRFVTSGTNPVDSDKLGGWNEMVLPAYGDAFYSPSDTLMHGFLGRVLVHVFEDKTAWQSRTGWTLS